MGGLTSEFIATDAWHAAKAPVEVGPEKISPPTF